MHVVRPSLIAIAAMVVLPAVASVAPAATSGAGAAPIKTLRVNWNESTSFRAGTLTVHVSKIVVRSASWSVTGSFRNRSPVSLQISRGYPTLRTAGMSLLYPAPHKRGEFGAFTVLEARTFSPKLPTTLRGGAAWSGTFTGYGVLPRKKMIYVSFGYFNIVGSDEHGFHWVTNHSFRL